jgi:hypothetical protein
MPQATPTPTADPARPLPSPVPSVVARVNGRPIALTQILPLAKGALARLPRSEQDKNKPAVLRMSLERHVERELLLQEALARGIRADSRRVDWAYDRARQDHRDEVAWKEHLAGEGWTPESFRAELRAQQTIAALLEKEILAAPIRAEEVRAAYEADPRAFGPAGAEAPPRFEDVYAQVERSVRLSKQGPIAAAFVERLRARARIELLL